MKPRPFVSSVLLAFACASHPATSATLHVWHDSPSPELPFASWTTAAHVIQDAVDAAVDGDTVLVTNGVYTTGGRAVYGLMTNRVAIDRAITLLSVNGPEVTVIEGAPAPEGSLGDGAIRCVYLGTNATLSGFSLRNGHTRRMHLFRPQEETGGGVLSEPSGMVTNCVLIGNVATWGGGGACGGTLYNCVLSTNLACNGGGAYRTRLYNCTLTNNAAGAGGATAVATVYNSVLADNRAEHGGGADGCTLYNCTLSGNQADRGGGGAFGGILYNCTVTGNSAGSYGGGTYRGILVNCIVYYNNEQNFDESVFLNSCTTPLLYGLGNITNDPAFLNAAAGDFHLAPDSPCIDAGKDLSHLITTDLDGNPRPLDGDGNGIAQFDMGAYEFTGELTPCEAVEELIRQVEESSLDSNRKRPLAATLVAACASFEGDKIDTGVSQLTAFQNKVRAQVTRVDAQLAEELIGAAQGIIDALTAPEPEPEPVPNMVWIPPGTFTMGSPPDEPTRSDWEGPQTEVTLSRGFWMGKYELTQGEYMAVLGSNPSYFTNGMAAYNPSISGPVTNASRRPVEQVTWFDATNYCALLTARERAAGRLPLAYEYRLPTEAEWEYACRAGTTTPFHYGNELRSGMANFNGYYEYPPCGGAGRDCYNPSGTYLGGTTPVGSYVPNGWELYDMHGNVYEWCTDWYGAYPGGNVTDPQGAVSGSFRMLRGGSWADDAGYCRSADRGGDRPEVRYWNFGFRVVLATDPR